MADRRALCLVNGGLEEISTADRLILPGDPLFDLHPASKQYVDRLVLHISSSGNSLFAKGVLEAGHRFNNNELAGPSGQLWLSYVTALTNTPITKLAVNIGNTAAVGTTLARLAFFTVASDNSITKVAQTANDPTIGANAYNVNERVLSTVGGLPASYTPVPGTRYALGYLHVATTTPPVSGAYVIDPYAEPVPNRVIGGQTDIAANYAVADINPHYFMVWMSARP